MELFTQGNIEILNGLSKAPPKRSWECECPLLLVKIFPDVMVGTCTKLRFAVGKCTVGGFIEHVMDKLHFPHYNGRITDQAKSKAQLNRA